jgi:hypothetical protein
LILFALAMSALAASGLTCAAALARTKRWWRVGGAAYAVAAVTLVLGVGPMWKMFYDEAARRELSPPPLAALGEEPFHQARGNRWALEYETAIQRGSLSCWDAYPIPESPLLRGDLPHEEYLADESAGHLTERAWSPNAIDLDVALDRPGRVVVNQNWHRGWRANAGEVKSERGLLAVDLPAGQHALSLRFAPRSARGGAWVSLAAIAALVIVARRRRALWKDALVAFALPVTVLAACVALMPEARGDAPPPLTLTGEPVIEDDLPQGAIRVDAAFRGGITLLSSSIDNPMPRAGETVHLELDWQRPAVIPPGVGIFVHIEPDKGSTMNGDHADLSQTLSFDRAPPGKVLRDVMPVTLPEDASGRQWKIWIGLWQLQGGGERLKIERSTSAIVENDRILAGVIEVQ